MRYIDIKDIVIGTTHDLGMVPSEVVTQLFGGEVAGITGNFYLSNIQQSRITCVTHAYMPSLYERSDMEVCMYHDGWTIKYDQQRVSTILVDGIPALFFIHVWPQESYVPYTYIYTLSHWRCTLFLLLVTGQNAVARTVFQVEDTDDVDDLVQANGVKITYGSITPP